MMKTSEHTFQAEDGTSIFYRKYIPDTETKAVLQIFHGMAEHSKRYENFAKFMTSNGISVYINDHRGHGKSITSMKEYGVLKNKDDWWRMIGDLKQLKDIASTDYPSIPYFVMGHSMGSFLARTFITKYSNEISGAIISGTGTNPTSVLVLGKCIAVIACSLAATHSKAILLDKLSFGSYNKGFSKPYQWLSRDYNEVIKYQDDDFCGGVFSNSFYRAFFSGLIYINKKSTGEMIDKNLKMFFISGDKDPVGNYGDGVRKSVLFYKSLNINNIDLKLYKSARHEILNEVNKQEVYIDILNWITKSINE